jgi:hypothetical protein
MLSIQDKTRIDDTRIASVRPLIKISDEASPVVTGHGVKEEQIEYGLVGKSVV